MHSNLWISNDKLFKWNPANFQNNEIDKSVKDMNEETSVSGLQFTLHFLW